MDTVQVTLANSKGKWLGNGIGNVWQNQISLLKQVKLLETGSYQVSVTQGMRHDTLKGISDIGVRVEKAL
jgi:gliding motility-associated lipoprotein GldH